MTPKTKARLVAAPLSYTLLVRRYFSEKSLLPAGCPLNEISTL